MSVLCVIFKGTIWWKKHRQNQSGGGVAVYIEDFIIGLQRSD